MGRDCPSERVPIALAEGRPEDPPGPAELWGARAFHPDQQQDHVSVAFAHPRAARRRFGGRSPEPPPPHPASPAVQRLRTRGQCAKAAVTHGSRFCLNWTAKIKAVISSARAVLARSTGLLCEKKSSQYGAALQGIAPRLRR
jgi:hypothetical protein